MNQILNNIAHAFTNLHVSLPVILGAGLGVSIIWFPHYAPQLGSTAAVLASYGIVAAANTPASAQTPAATTTPKP
jgi:hypothetical protein